MDNETIKFNIPTQQNEDLPIIKVVGVGGGGGNAVSNMYDIGIKNVSFAVCNTDRQVLSESKVPTKLQIGPGLGAGGDPEMGKKFAEEDIESIKNLFDDGTQMVFITAGMGGGTGTGAAPVIAQVAKSMNILTVGIVTIPFLFEMKPRIMKALKGIDELRKNVDALLIINNQRILEIYNADMKATEAFKRADSILTTAAKSIAEIITMKGDINRDFKDVEATLKNGSKAIMTIGIAKGENRIQKAIKNALDSPLLQDNDISRVKRMLCVLFTGEKTPLRVSEISQMNDFMNSLENQDIEFSMGLYQDDTLEEEAKITIIATGFDTNNDNPQDNDEKQTETLIEKYYGTNDIPQINQKPDPTPIEIPHEEKIPEQGSIIKNIKNWISGFLED